MRFFILLLILLQVLVSSEEEAGMLPPDGEVDAAEKDHDTELPLGGAEDDETSTGDEEEFLGDDDDETFTGDHEEFLGDDDDGLDEFDFDGIDLENIYDLNFDDFDEEELAALVDHLYAQMEPYDDGYGETALGEEYEDTAVYMDGEEHDVGDEDFNYNPEEWDLAEEEWEFDDDFDIEISEGDLLNIDYCEHFTSPDDGALKMNQERCEEVESAFCDCENRPDFYYTPEQCLMLKYQFSFDYLMQDCCLDETVENNLCSDYMEALALCECHPDEGECTEDEMMEDCDYLWDETMHMCRNITAQGDWPVCDDEPLKPDLRTELRR